jgi:tRNA(fMet)-specific endonuclease VapC
VAESYVLDTGVLLLLARGKALGTAVAGRYGLLNPGVRPLISVVSHGELWALARRNEWGERRTAFVRRGILENVVTVELSQPVIDAYVELDYASHKHPGGARNMGKNDLWIAATARAAQATLITTDGDFDHLHPHLLKRELVPLTEMRGSP